MQDVSEVGVPLAAAIEALRGELVVALEKGKDAEVRFALGPVELEFQVEVSREVGADAGVKFWVLALGGKGKSIGGDDAYGVAEFEPGVGG